jgi:hypothetical protein
MAAHGVSVRIAGTLLLWGTSTCVFAADATATATGTFKSDSVTLPARSAVAFRGKSSAGDETLIVAVSNARLNAAAIGDYLDRRRVIDTRVKDGVNGVVYFEFTPEGDYRGVSYAFGPGNGCASCASGAVSTVKLAGGNLSGKVHGEDNGRSFDITLVAPLMSDEHGAALPADGGAPGKAYLAYHAALLKADRAALKPLLSKDQRQFWDDSEDKGGLGAFLHAMGAAHPTKSVAIVRGYATADKAILAIAGETSAGRLAGEVLLVREGDAWRVDDEVTAVVAAR